MQFMQDKCQFIDDQITQFYKNVGIESVNISCSDITTCFAQYLKDRNAVWPQLQNLLSGLNYSNRVQHTESRLCGGLLKKGDKAYKCHNCICEDNSILCAACFDLQKHKDHQFERIDVYGGCCDCGDVQKWKQSGFCNKHQNDQEIIIELDEKLVGQFIERVHSAFLLLLSLYKQFQKQFQTIKKMLISSLIIQQNVKTKIKKLTLQIEKYGCEIFEQLIKFNKVGKYANAMTHRLLHSKLKYPQTWNTFFKGTTFLQVIFQLPELTAVPQKICDLCITLFPMNGFRKQITVFYINLYNKNYRFSTSTYTHLSSQLFTSHIVILELINNKQIQPIIFHPPQKSEKSLQEIAQSFLRYYYDIMYLSKLHGNSSVEYFKYHGRCQLFKDLGYFRILWNNNQKGVNYYGLQQIYLNKMLLIANVAEKDSSQQIYKLAFKELYHFITNYQNGQNNMYRSQQRLFTLFAFSYLKYDINQLDNSEVMKQFIQMLEAVNIVPELLKLLASLCNYLSKISKLLQNNTLIQQNITLFSFYFKRSSLLFNLDAILMKILIKLFKYINKTGQKQINYQQTFMDCVTKYQDDLNSLKINKSKEGCQFYLRYFVNYLSLVTQSIYSDLPELALSCQLYSVLAQTQMKNENVNDKIAYHYYSNILKSSQNPKISIKQFKINCQIFFKEQVIFKKFVNDHMDSKDCKKLDAEKSKGSKINIAYFKSISCKTAKQYSGPIIDNPYFQKNEKNRFTEIDLSSYTQRAEEIIQFYNTLEAKNKIPKQSLYNSLIGQLWKIVFQTKHDQLYNHLKSKTDLSVLIGQASPLNRQIHNFISDHNTNSFINQHSGNDESKKQKTKNKKNQMNKKIMSNANTYLEQYEETNAHSKEEICCICRQSNISEQSICCPAFATMTNCNGWFGLNTQKTAILMYNSCKHFVHRQCFSKTKTMKNTIYSFCSVCKSPINILLPTDTSNSDQIKLFLSQSQQLIRLITGEAIGSNGLQFLSQSIYMQIFTKGLLQPTQFTKNRLLYQILIQMLIKADNKFYQQEQQKYIQKNMEDIRMQIQKQFIQKIIENNKLFETNKLSDKFISKIRTSINLLLFQQDENADYLLQESNIPEINILRQTIQFPSIETSLMQLSNKHMGKCPNCQLITNLQTICLICNNFVTCISCQHTKISKHCEQRHCKVGCFLKTFTGEVIYLYNNRIGNFQSLYQDYIGRPFDGGRKDKGQYKLVDKKLKAIQEDILNYNLEWKIRYKEKIQNKVNYNQSI